MQRALIVVCFSSYHKSLTCLTLIADAALFPPSASRTFFCDIQLGDWDKPVATSDDQVRLCYLGYRLLWLMECCTGKSVFKRDTMDMLEPVDSVSIDRT